MGSATNRVANTSFGVKASMAPIKESNEKCQPQPRGRGIITTATGRKRRMAMKELLLRPLIKPCTLKLSSLIKLLLLNKMLSKTDA